MATQFIQKVDSLTRVRNLPTGAGIGFYGGRFYGNANGTVAPLSGPWFGNVLNVDGDNGSDSDTRLPYKTIQAAVTAASAGDSILVKPLAIAAGATDPSNYAETVIIPATKAGLRVLGDASGPAQGAQPQVKIGAGSTAMFTVRAPGVVIGGLTINGASSTGGGILLDDDATTKAAFGTIIEGCYFKNCQGALAAATGGAIQWASTGGAWQIRISGNRFFNNRCGIMKLGSSVSKPKEVVIEDCEFASDANTTVDADIYFGVATGAGAGVLALTIEGCKFQTVDAPAYASSPDAARYVDLTGSSGLICNCDFACLVGPTGETELTFGANGTAAKIPATVRMSRLYGEALTATGSEGLIGRF